MNDPVASPSRVNAKCSRWCAVSVATLVCSWIYVNVTELPLGDASHTDLSGLIVAMLPFGVGVAGFCACGRGLKRMRAVAIALLVLALWLCIDTVYRYAKYAL
jgi:hypothetical protein